MLRHPIVASRINDQKLAHAPVIPLKCFLKDRVEHPQRVRFSVAGYNAPKDGYVKVLNTKTGEVSAATAKNVPKDKNHKLVFNVELFAKDTSNPLANQFVRVNLMEDGQEGRFFADLKPQDVLKSQKDRTRFTQVLDNLSRFNVWVDGVVEQSDNGLIVLDGKKTCLKVF